MQAATQPWTGEAPRGEPPMKSLSFRVERKHITLDLKENPRGRFLRITEEVNGRRDAVIVPVAGLEDFRAALDEVIKFNSTVPLKH